MRVRISGSLILIISLIIWSHLSVSGQKIENLRFETYSELPQKLKGTTEVLRGISGAEYSQIDSLIYLVSDQRESDDFMSVLFRFKPDSRNPNQSYFDSHKLDFSGAEAISIIDGHLIYSYESPEGQTGIFISSQNSINNVDVSKFKLPIENRGIEAIATRKLSNNQLEIWSIPESGMNEKCNKNPSIIKVYEVENGIPESGHSKEYKYPFNNCECLNPVKRKMDGNYGNGVSEMKFYGNTLLVLERCFDGTNGCRRLFSVELNGNENKGSLLEKTLLIDFDEILESRGISQPENLEAFCIVPPENGRTGKLLFFSDDNFKDFLHTQLITFEFDD